ncbi:MAG: hypothetical protein KJP00_07275, partial [Bacteroidia bacterium]|nr:hypothetical protein [Bacteroidia bacterium]
MTMLRQYSTPILLSAVVILSLTFYNHAQNSRTIIQDKDDNIEVLRTSVTEIEGQFNDALNHNTVLTNENTSLKERIAILKKQVANLRWKVKVQDKNIASYKTTLTSLQNELREKEQLLAKMNASALTKDQAIT